MRKIHRTISTLALVTGMAFAVTALADDLGNGGGKNPGDTVNGGHCLKNCAVKSTATTTGGSTTAAKVKTGVKSDEIIGPKNPLPPTK